MCLLLLLMQWRHSNGIKTHSRDFFSLASKRNKSIRVGVRLGEYDITKDVDCIGYYCADPVLLMGVDEKIPHELYNERSKNRENDIGLVRMSGEVRYSDYIKPICLPSSVNSRGAIPNEKLVSAGWGRTLQSNFSISFASSIIIILISKWKIRSQLTLAASLFQRVKVQPNWALIYRPWINNRAPIVIASLVSKLATASCALVAFMAKTHATVIQAIHWCESYRMFGWSKASSRLDVAADKLDGLPSTPEWHHLINGFDTNWDHEQWQRTIKVMKMTTHNTKSTFKEKNKMKTSKQQRRGNFESVALVSSSIAEWLWLRAFYIYCYLTTDNIRRWHFHAPKTERNKRIQTFQAFSFHFSILIERECARTRINVKANETEERNWSERKKPRRGDYANQKLYIFSMRWTAKSDDEKEENVVIKQTIFFLHFSLLRFKFVRWLLSSIFHSAFCVD